MIVGLYTSRVVLNVLGVEDFGIYGVVGSVVAMMGFINASMSNATSRFISFEIGKENEKKLNETFISAFIIHIIFAFVIVVLGETIGLWFLCNEIVIPEERMFAAHFVYQMSLLSAAIGITQAPYSACIMSHEKMDIYAYFELLHVFLKLVIVFLLIIADWDKLIVYSILVFSVSVFMQILYRIYCKIHYKETKLSIIWNSRLIKKMLAFSGQTIIAHFSFSIRQQGINFVLNILFGVIVNAASGIVSTINGIVSQFSQNILVAFNPPIIKSYATGNIEEMNRLILNASKYSVLLLALFVIPIEFEMHQILKLWLGIIPDYSVIFARISLISLFSAITNPLYTGLMATGNIKRFSYIQGLLYILTPFFAYYICLLTHRPEFSYLLILLVQVIVSIITILFFKFNVISFSLRSFLKVVFFDLILPIFFVIIVLLLVRRHLNESISRLFITICLSSFLIVSITFLRLDKELKIKILNKFNLYDVI